MSARFRDTKCGDDPVVNEKHVNKCGGYRAGVAFQATLVSHRKMSIESERNAAEKVRGVLALLAPSTAYVDHIVHPLRLAAGIATSAMSQGLSSQAGLNIMRSDVTGALNAVIR